MLPYLCRSNALNPWTSIWHMYVPQDMETDKDAVYCDTVYSNDRYTPEQKSVGLGWKWAY